MKQKKPITIVLLGDIAAGKGTQAKILAKKFRLHYIGVGDFSRKMARKNANFARINKGSLAPSDAVQRYLQSQISKLKPEQSVLVDGGKMPAEARLIDKLLKKQKRLALAIYLTVPHKESFRRTAGRLRRQGRADDTPEAIHNRIKYYRRVYSKTVKFWDKQGILRRVSGVGTIAAATVRLNKIIRSYYRQSLR